MINSSSITKNSPANSFFSFAYSAGDTKDQICWTITGMPITTAATRQDLNLSISASLTAVEITSMPRERTGSSTKSTSGVQKR